MGDAVLQVDLDGGGDQEVHPDQIVYETRHLKHALGRAPAQKNVVLHLDENMGPYVLHDFFPRRPANSIRGRNRVLF